MNRKIGLILVSHGYFAKGAVDAAEMILGKQEDIISISVLPGMDLGQVKDNILKALDELKCERGVLIITDIIGGTPSNAAAIIAAKRDDILVLTGLNMPMLLEFLSNREITLNDIPNKICKIGKENILSLSEAIKSRLVNNL